MAKLLTSTGPFLAEIILVPDNVDWFTKDEDRQGNVAIVLGEFAGIPTAPNALRGYRVHTAAIARASATNTMDSL